MIALLLRLAAPMQAWGTQSRFSERDTQLEPSKSGVIGILAAALGRPRDADLSDLAQLEMAVRVDREGRKMKDFHTVGGGNAPDWFCAMHGMKQKRGGGYSYGVSKANSNTPETAISNRYYLADARFLVTLGTSDESQRAFLDSLAGALRAPVNQLFLGRKSFVPAEPIIGKPGEDILEGESLRQIVETIEWAPQEPDLRWDRDDQCKKPRVEHLRLVLESPDPSRGFPRVDVPLCFEKGKREFATRHVIVEFTKVPLNRWQESQSAKESVA